jgi:hypothetical protein
VRGFHNPGPAHAKLLILVYPAAGLGIVEELVTLEAATVGAPDPAVVRAIFARYKSEVVQPS